MPNRLLGYASYEDVQAAYLLLLGRPAENTEAIEKKIRRPIVKMAGDFVSSNEFKQIAKQAVQTGRLAHERLSHNDYVAAAAWLRRLSPALGHAVHDWWSLLHAFFGVTRVEALVDSEEFAAFRRLVARRMETDAQQFQHAQPFLTFDESWYLRSHEKARLTLASGAVDSAIDYFLDTGLAERQQLLPFFSEGFERSYQKFRARDDYVLGDVLAQLFRDARAGHLSHWLFSQTYYRDVLEWQRDAHLSADRVLPADTGLLLDFLTYGDAKGYAPHPLFCHYAYKTLNPSAALRHGPTFYDYVTEGCFAGRRTSIMFDDDYYLASNADARYALLTGTAVSALHHFLKVGIYRDAPFSPDFDAGFYLNQYPDIQAALNKGEIKSAAHHFIHRGLCEGRRSSPYFNPVFYRQRHPQAPDEMRRLGIRSEIEHFLMIGKARGYKPEQPLVTTRPAMDAAKAVFQRRARRSFSNLTRDPRDFTPFAADPAISLVVPVFNEVEFTARFLDCAYFAVAHLKHTTGLDCEVIVVDNGSTDGTDALLDACSGLVVASYDEPIGFPRAINAGVGRARGGIIIVANNDIEFAPDVLWRVRVRLMADAAIGMLGGLTILPNETLQEAGSFLDSKGSPIGVGRYEDPWNQYFQGVHEADYCTGSFIAFRRGDYAAVGGFDETFSPGYYEETDFSFRLFETLGKKAAIDSAIQVTHFEHASFGKGRPPTTAYALIRRNQAHFISKHHEALRRRPAPLALHGMTGACPLAIGRTRLLVIEDLMPDTRLGSGFVRSSQLLAALTRFGVAYDLLVLQPSTVVDDYCDPRVNVYRNWMPGEDFSAIVSRQAGSYSHIMVCRTHNLMRFGGELEVLRHQYGFKLICDTEALSALRVLEMQRLAGRAADDAAQLDAIRLELTTPALVSHWIAVSPYERDQIAAAISSSASVICHHFPRTPADALQPFEARQRVLAVGAIHEGGSPNHDGLLWFMDRIYPRCREALEGLILTMVGYWHPDIQDSFAARCKGIEIDFAGVSSDRELTRLYGEARIAVAPTRFAAGVASKVLEPMMLGVPAVITDLLETQLVGAAAAGSGALAVGRRDDDGESFARWVSLLATDAAAWTRVQAAQYGAAMPLASQAAFDEGVRDLILATGLLPQSGGEPARVAAMAAARPA